MRAVRVALANRYLVRQLDREVNGDTGRQDAGAVVACQAADWRGRCVPEGGAGPLNLTWQVSDRRRAKIQNGPQ